MFQLPLCSPQAGVSPQLVRGQLRAPGRSLQTHSQSQHFVLCVSDGQRLLCPSGTRTCHRLAGGAGCVLQRGSSPGSWGGLGHQPPARSAGSAGLVPLSGQDKERSGRRPRERVSGKEAKQGHHLERALLSVMSYQPFEPPGRSLLGAVLGSPQVTGRKAAPTDLTPCCGQCCRWGQTRACDPQDHCLQLRPPLPSSPRLPDQLPTGDGPPQAPWLT